MEDKNKYNFEVCLKKAERGDRNDQYNLGNMLLQGKGCAVDKEKAFGWFKRSADQNNSNAQFMLGNMLRSGEGCVMDEQRALDMYQKSAAKGNANAQFNLGSMYLARTGGGGGVGCQINHEKAMTYYQLAATQGHAEALFHLGEILRAGKVCRKDEITAVEMLWKSANAGMHSAQCSLGYMYERGLGCTQNPRRAFDLYLEAALKGNLIAQLRIGLCYKKGVGCAISKAMYMTWFRKATADRPKLDQLLMGEENQDLLEALGDYDKPKSEESTQSNGVAETAAEPDNSVPSNSNNDHTKRVLAALWSLGEAPEREGVTDVLRALSKIVASQGEKLEDEGKVELAREYDVVSRICDPQAHLIPKVFQSPHQQPSKSQQGEEIEKDPKQPHQLLVDMTERLREYKEEVVKREKGVAERGTRMGRWFSQQAEQRSSWVESCAATVELVSSVHSL